MITRRNLWIAFFDLGLGKVSLPSASLNSWSFQYYFIHNFKCPTARGHTHLQSMGEKWEHKIMTNNNKRNYLNPKLNGPS